VSFEGSGREDATGAPVRVGGAWGVCSSVPLRPPGSKKPGQCWII
jgi:hypothetical protein